MKRLFHIVLLGVIALSMPAAARAASPSMPSEPEDPALSRLAYSTLQRNETLADLNIGVRVLKGGTAILWGTAHPSESAKAVEVLKKLPGITSVKNTCESEGASDPLVRQVEQAIRSAAPPEPRSGSTPPLPPALPGNTLARHSTSAEKPPLAPVSRREPATKLLDPAPASPIVDYAAIERVRRSEARFARLTFDLRDGRVVIGGSAERPADAWDLARKVSGLVGDRDVVVGRVGR